MHESIDEGDDAAGIGEDFGPFSERLIRSDNDGGFSLVAASDDLEETRSDVARVIGEIPTSSMPKTEGWCSDAVRRASETEESCAAKSCSMSEAT